MTAKYVKTATPQTAENKFKALSEEKIADIKRLRSEGLSVPKTAIQLGLSETVVRKYSREFPFSRNSYGTPRHYSEKNFTPEQIEIALRVLELQEKRRASR